MASSLLHCSDKLPFMDVETILHMKEGLGETSYAQNSSLQVSNYSPCNQQPFLFPSDLFTTHSELSLNTPYICFCRSGAWTR